MRKAVIPVIFVLCGALASSLWSKVRFPFGVPVDIVSGSVSDLGFWALRSGFQFAKEVPGSPHCVVPVLFHVALKNAFDGLSGGRGEDIRHVEFVAFRSSHGGGELATCW